MEDQEAKILRIRKEFESDTVVLGEQASDFIQCVSPYLMVDNASVKQYLDRDSLGTIASIRFFRLESCTTENIKDLAEYLQERMDKLFTALYSLGEPIAYGVVSYEGKTNLTIGVGSKEMENVIQSLIRGLLTGIELTPYKPDFEKRHYHTKNGGVISSVPILKLGDDRQRFDISTLMKSLNGQNYTVLFMAKPYSLKEIQRRYNEIISVRDKCFAISKKNLARQRNDTITKSDSVSTSKTSTWSAIIYSSSNTSNISSSLAKAIGSSETISSDIQNGFALELMSFCDKAIERLKQGQSIGMWGTAIAYSADSTIAANLIKSCLSGELAKSSTDVLPLRQYEYTLGTSEEILIPAMTETNPLLVPITSAELGMICTLPFESVPDFELKQGKVYPMVASDPNGVVIGKISDGHRPLPGMVFSLSEEDLNKHTFVCGITGSGKTTTVKGILRNCNKPFMVIESAKKEYRNICLPENRKKPVIYTLGKPELNCLQFNPFYIQYGINLQTHIDFLKDLFNASFSFYGPMPYILEKCLHNIYKKKGWNLTLGYHPQLVNLDNPTEIFDSVYMKKQYAMAAHRYLFPNMQDLKNEVKRYIEEEMQYDSEVGGNVKTAILARLESLCIGSKGFMFNTYEPFAAEELLQQNVIFELEGLADDSDKAFCVGLLVVFINEYRQVFKDEHPTERLALQHLLVIEEAHRLLKNIDTERSSENMGNPKGKAVEHFTNMIAEMRSYGQGVIIAEQIPTKLAPDVIKNSSNKIIQRIVSIDDQSLVANTIGIKEEDAVYLGSLRTGVALCHKEGMSLPVYVFVNLIKDNIVSDGDILLSRAGTMFKEINYSLLKENTVAIIEVVALRLLNTLLAQNADEVVQAIQQCKSKLDKELLKKNTSLVMCRDKDDLFGNLLAEAVIQLLINGIYCINEIPSDALYNALIELFVKGRSADVDKVKTQLRDAYKQECRNRCILIISELIKFNLSNAINIKASIQQYFFDAPIGLIEEIETAVRKEVI